MEKQFRTQYLNCGCCGQYFNTWPGYEDQGQDKGFGICLKCQKDAEKKEKSLIDEAINNIFPHLKPENQEKLKKMSYAEKRYVVCGLIDKGCLVWKIAK